MATKKSQRIGIWVIAIVMVVGTLASFLALILAPSNEAADQTRLQALSAQYQKDYEAYQQKVDAQSAELSKKYFDQFNAYSDRPAEFNPDDVSKVTTKDLKTGTGQTLDKDTSYSAYYIGWNPTGEVFDQSIDGDRLKAPIAGGNLIEGWNEGVVGMKVGGVREITIPSDKAYGEAGSGDAIPPNTPIKFIVMIIEQPEKIAEPEIPEELLRQYGTQ